MNHKPTMSRKALRAALILAALTIFLVVLVVTTVKATAAPATPTPLDKSFHQIVGPDHHVGFKRLRVVDAEGYAGRADVFYLNDGSQWVAKPCKTEDSRNCFWDAERRGNYCGQTFLNIHGHIVKFGRPLPCR